MADRPVVLTFVRHYLPGYKSGGPIRTLEKMVERLGEQVHFRIVTLDRDFGDPGPYEAIRVGEWNRVGNGEVLYLPRERIGLLSLRRLLAETPHDLLYTNSFFDPLFTIPLLTLRRLGIVRSPLVVAPRGEFSPGALRIKAAKKRLYLALARSAGLYRAVRWQASADQEAQDIRRHFPKAECLVAPDLSLGAMSRKGNGKQPGRLRLVFLSRISPKKNLDGALEMLSAVGGEVHFDIHGPIDDGNYWAKCQRIIDTLPDNITVTYRGPVPHEQVPSTLARHDFLFFPTHGENFGHVIAEAFSVGCPVILSDQTPWHDLEQAGAGWVVPLTDRERFIRILHRCQEMEPGEYAGMVDSTLAYFEDRLVKRQQEDIARNLALFKYA